MKNSRRKVMIGLIAALAVLTAGAYSVKSVTDVYADNAKISETSPMDISYSSLFSELTEVKKQASIDNASQVISQVQQEPGLAAAEQAQAVASTDNTSILAETQAPVSGPVITDTNQTMWSVASVNVRSGCGPSYSVIGTLSYGQGITVTGTADNGWNRIDYNNTIGYVKASYLQAQEIQAPVQPPAPVYSGRVLLEGGAGTSLASLTESYLSKISPSIVNAFYNSGWAITVTTYDIASTYYGSTSLGTLAGLTMTGRSMIYLAASSNSIQRAAVHEFGHAFDCMNGFPSQSEEFKAIFNEEKAIFGSGYITSNSYEYFAECFNKYFSGTLGAAPKTNDFMSRLVSKY